MHMFSSPQSIIHHSLIQPPVIIQLSNNHPSVIQHSSSSHPTIIHRSSISHHSVIHQSSSSYPTSCPCIAPTHPPICPPAAGADVVGGEELINEIIASEGKSINFDKVCAWGGHREGCSVFLVFLVFLPGQALADLRVSC